MYQQPSSQRAPRSPRAPLSTELQVKLRAEIRDRSVEEIAAEMGVSHNTVANMAAGRGCNASTKTLARIYFSERETS